MGPPFGRARGPAGNDSTLKAGAVPDRNALPVARMKCFLLVAVRRQPKAAVR
jgi:hypothetical protein